MTFALKNRIVRNAAFGLSISLFAYGAPGASYAQSKVEWSQVLDIPKGAKMPRGVKAEILGIETGDTFEEAKAKLEKLAAEWGVTVPIRRVQSVMRYQGIGVPTHFSRLEWRHDRKGVTNRPISEQITVFFSSPASGHQVVAIERLITYVEPRDQPRLSELLPQLAQKYGGQPQMVMSGSGTAQYRFQYNDGRLFVPRNASIISCALQHHANAQTLNRINETGDCDVILQVQTNYGISPDHIESLSFKLSDNDRVKANFGADYKFLEPQLQQMLEKTRGSSPKL